MKVNLFQEPMTEAQLEKERLRCSKQKKLYQRIFCVALLVGLIVVVSGVFSNKLSVKDATLIFTPGLVSAFVAAIAMVTTDAVNRKRSVTVLCVSVAIISTCGLPNIVECDVWLSNSFGSVFGALIGCACYYKLGCIAKTEHSLGILSDELNIWMFEQSEQYQHIDKYVNAMERIKRTSFTNGEHQAVLEFKEGLCSAEVIFSQCNIKIPVAEKPS